MNQFMAGVDFITQISSINTVSNLCAFRFVFGTIKSLFESICDQNKVSCIPMGIKNAQKT